MSGEAVSDTAERRREQRGGSAGAWWAPARVAFAGLALLATAVVPSASATTQPVPAPAGTFAYVTNGLAGSLSVIDTADNTVTSTIDVGDDPNGVAVSPDGNRVFVANRLSDTVSLVVPAAGGSVSVPVGDNPVGVAVSPDGTRAYVTNTISNNMTVITADTIPPSVIATVHVGTRPQDVAIAPNGTRAYVANLLDGTVAVVDTTTNTLLDSIPVGQLPQGVAVSPDGARVYVTNFGDGTVSVIDTATAAVRFTIPIGNDTSPADVAVSRDGTRAYVADFGSDEVTVIDTTANPPAVIATVPVGEEPLGVAVTPDGAHVYVTNSMDNTVSVIDTATRTVTGTVGGFAIPLGVAVGTRAVGETPTALTLTAEPNGKGHGNEKEQGDGQGNGHGNGNGRGNGDGPGKEAPGTRGDRGPILKARLTVGGTPLEDGSVVFTSDSDVLCADTTDSRGRATCAVRGRQDADACYTATFAGDDTHAAATATTCTDRRAAAQRTFPRERP
ncbi:beta-propeller fold lactonase family protein [Streptomyces sp. NPDC056492]|uniref:beta-propeller fold lactonase family protein n=1 Tax=unclassified Streptomyces TaxID=2593676 RepID=UPI0036C63666